MIDHDYSLDRLLKEVHSTGAPSIKSPGAIMKRIFVACAAVAAMGLLASTAWAELSAEAARASVAPFYKALNAEFANDSPVTHQAGDRAAVGVLSGQRNLQQPR
jgi:hypothetical protein